MHDQYANAYMQSCMLLRNQLLPSKLLAQSTARDSNPFACTKCKLPVTTMALLKNIEVRLASGQKMNVATHYPSGKSLLECVTHALPDPACTVRLMVDSVEVGLPIFEQKQWAVDLVQSDYITAVVAKASPEKGTIHAYDSLDGDEVGRYARHFVKIEPQYDPTGILPTMPRYLHQCLKEVPTEGGQHTTKWGIRFRTDLLELAVCFHCGAATTVFGALLNDWVDAGEHWWACSRHSSGDDRIFAVCSRCEFPLRNSDMSPNMRPQEATKPPDFLPMEEFEEYSELWCSCCSVNHSGNFSGC